MGRVIIPMTTLPLLDVAMRLKQATNIALAEASGVSDRTIGKARLKQPIKAHLAECICQALHERDFAYQKRGPKPGTRWTRKAA